MPSSRHIHHRLENRSGHQDLRAIGIRAMFIGT
jgi:hypothetical protein